MTYLRRRMFACYAADLRNIELSRCCLPHFSANSMLGSFLLMGIGLAGVAPARAQAPGSDFYLLSASTDASKPSAILFRLAINGKLSPVRSLAGNHEGPLRVTSSSDSIFVTQILPDGGHSGILHKALPMLDDEVAIPSAAAPAAMEGVTVRSATDGSTELLFLPALSAPAVKTPAQDTPVVALESNRFVQPRVHETGQTFPLVEFPGHPATRSPEAPVVAWEQQGMLVQAGYPHLIYDRQVPQGLQLSKKRNGPVFTAVVASSERYLIIFAEPDVAVPPRADTALYMHNRSSNTWSELRVDGSSNSSMRLFGDWLAVRVELPADLTGVQSASVAVKGKSAGATDHLANYPQSYFPGYALLRNLQTGREVRIKTGVADTEVEAISGDTVFYRVGEKLFRGQVAGKNVVNAEQVANDPVIRDVHWIFPAPTTAP